MTTQRKLTLKMISRLLAAFALSTIFAGATSAHHSFAVYDFDTETAFEGTVETINFKNPHIAMTLSYVDDDGETKIANFVEGAPANMLIRSGFIPAWLDPGSKITAIGSPRHDNPEAMFLKAVILEDGTEHRSVGR
jgi:hypothetical protein